MLLNRALNVKSPVLGKEYDSENVRAILTWEPSRLTPGQRLPMIELFVKLDDSEFSVKTELGIANKFDGELLYMEYLFGDKVVVSYYANTLEVWIDEDEEDDYLDEP